MNEKCPTLTTHGSNTIIRLLLGSLSLPSLQYRRASLHLSYSGRVCAELHTAAGEWWDYLTAILAPVNPMEPSLLAYSTSWNSSFSSSLSAATNVPDAVGRAVQTDHNLSVHV